MASKLVNKAGKAVLATGNLATSAYTDFSKLLKDFNVIGFVLGLLIANGVAEIANSFIDGILMPSVQPILDKISKKGTQVKIGGLTLHLEKFITSVLKFFMISLVIFGLLKLGVSMSKPITWVKIVADDTRSA
mgnify:FL=1